ncbi:hypothetical protein HYPSUDRAFT_66248 [Hypholoma sublateritium FD-334 SS-4]|uniref:FAD/NAD(P)-binding domain-containing protein n=1 Tax=Hypholoma sublateritium (strain FD-334 SS-4) TaxID=945553 RepID=A0A0D2P4E0_HYPSF|nr:hypothetical protein HYPSUDRAFT_66248 [Hypholoma sublateritium FD-334 SS-4]
MSSQPGESGEFAADGLGCHKPIHSPRRLKVICIGAGASGLLLAYKLQRSFDYFDLTIYEKNEDISGTWFENTYPGCACDMPAHVYTYTFEPNPNWSSVYASSREIRNYFDCFATKYDLRKYISLRHQVVGAIWKEETGEWEVDVKNLEDGTIKHDSCSVLINATGITNAWKWPEIDGLYDFKGPLLHTALWDASVELEGKHVGIIGNGSSGLQVLPAISPLAKKVTNFIRGPAWVVQSRTFESRTYSEEERRRFAADPELFLAYRKQLEMNVNELFPVLIADSPAQRDMLDATKKQMQNTLQDKALEELVIPTFPLGCRRLTPGPGYLEALASGHVDVVFGEIAKITEHGCVSATGQEHHVDVLICATGFDVSYRPRFPLIGSSGGSLAEAWASEAQSYLGIAAHDFPNYFMFIGPNSPCGNGSLIVAVEAQADYMLRMINRWQTENIHSFMPKKKAVEDFIAFKDEFMKATVWTHNCKSWYKNGDHITGKVTALWPGSTLHYLEAIAEPRYEDWDFKIISNRFAFLGNGRSQVESDSAADWAYYVRNEDDGPYLSRLKRAKLVSRSGSAVRQ